MPSDNYLDEIYAFFQNCYHIKDWIKNDPQLSASVRGQVENHITQSPELRVCADLCNAQKHFTLRSTRSGSVPQQGPRHFHLGLGVGEEAILSLRFDVQSGSTTYDAFDLATRCMAAWAAFLNGAGYQISVPSSVAPPTTAASVETHVPTIAVAGSTANLVVSAPPRGFLPWVRSRAARAFGYLWQLFQR